MVSANPIPVFTLYGETEPFPDLVHCERISDRSAALGWTIKPHRHASMSQLVAIQSGGVSATIDGAQAALAAGHFAFIPGQVVHAFAFEPDTKGYVLSFPLHVIASVEPNAAEIAEALGAPFHAPLNDALRRLLQALDAALTAQGPFRAQKALGLAHALLAELAEARGQPPLARRGETHQRLDRLTALVSANMERGWTVSDYAAALSVSTGHLSRLCRERTGMGAQAHIEQIIMQEACRLLAFTLLPVAEIGYRTGFADPSYFSKRFKALRGQSPRDYRRQFATRPDSLDKRAPVPGIPG